MANKFDFESLFETYASRFEAQEFYDKSEYLTWFHGKDLRTAFNKQADASKGLKGWNFSFTKYVEDFCSIENTELKFEVDLKKRPEFADLVELKKKIEDLGKRLPKDRSI